MDIFKIEPGMFLYNDFVWLVKALSKNIYRKYIYQKLLIKKEGKRVCFYVIDGYRLHVAEYDYDEYTKSMSKQFGVYSVHKSGKIYFLAKEQDFQYPNCKGIIPKGKPQKKFKLTFSELSEIYYNLIIETEMCFDIKYIKDLIGTCWDVEFMGKNQPIIFRFLNLQAVVMYKKVI